MEQLEIQNPPPLEFQHIKLNQNNNQNLGVSLNILDEEDKPHTKEVTYPDS